MGDAHADRAQQQNAAAHLARLAATEAGPYADLHVRIQAGLH